MINERQITYLLTLAEERNITHAAKKLYVSQPALSRMLLDLEKELNVELFSRNHGTLTPTQAGEIYLKGCRDALAISNSVNKQLEDLQSSKSGQIILGSTAVTGEFVFHHLLQAFENKFPHVELVPKDARMNELPDLVKTGKIDMAIMYQTNEKELLYTPFLDNPVYVQVPASFVKATGAWKTSKSVPKIKASQLKDQPFILLKKGRAMRTIADSLFTRFQITPVRTIETESILLANKLVELGKGITFVPGIAAHDFAQQNSNAFYCEIEDFPMKRSLYFCQRKGTYQTEAERYLVNEIPALLAGIDSI